MPAAAIPHVDPYHGVFGRKNDGVAEGQVPYQAGDALSELAIHMPGHLNVERPGQDDHVLKTVIRQVWYGTNADLEFGACLSRPLRGERHEVFRDGCNF